MGSWCPMFSLVGYAR